MTSQRDNQGNKNSSPFLLSSVVTWPKSVWRQRRWESYQGSHTSQLPGSESTVEKKDKHTKRDRFPRNEFCPLLIEWLSVSCSLQDGIFLASLILQLTLLLFIVFFDTQRRHYFVNFIYNFSLYIVFYCHLYVTLGVTLTANLCYPYQFFSFYR